jgi:predicted short-subunit dehydrogenase-like oxidoreductase (DUF2520 family)
MKGKARVARGSRTPRPEIAIVGAGNFGTALATSLRAAQYKVNEIVSREGKLSRRRARALAQKIGAHATVLGKSDISADVVWLCVPDGEIAGCARELAPQASWQGKVVVHSSGALSSDELAVLRRRGAEVASAHPLMTFVPGVTPSLAGVGFAVEGDAAAVRVVQRIIVAMGGKVYPIRKRDKAMYHAWGTFVSPLLTALLAMSERVAEAAGVNRAQARRRMLPIARQTVENYGSRGAALGFSGPIVRGDTATVRQHLKVLRDVPGASEVYRAVARAALRILPAKNRKQLARVLGPH